MNIYARITFELIHNKKKKTPLDLFTKLEKRGAVYVWVEYRGGDDIEYRYKIKKNLNVKMTMQQYNYGIGSLKFKFEESDLDNEIEYVEKINYTQLF